MKKLMFIAASALCASVFADGAITSANIVGFVKGDAANGYKPMGSAFIPVGGGEVDIQEIKPALKDGGEIENDTYFIYELSTAGAATSYYTYENADGEAYPKTGWYNEDGEYVEGVTYKHGQGFIFDVDADDVQVQTAGQVELGEVTTPVVNGYCPTCNPYPVKISIQDITPVPPEGTEEIENDTYFIYELSTAGAATSYYTYENADGEAYLKTGWYNEDGEYVEDRFFEAGEGFIFDVDADDCGVAFTYPQS